MAREIGRKTGSFTAGEFGEGEGISRNSFCYRDFPPLVSEIYATLGFIFNEWGLRQADAYIDLLIGAIDQLVENPEIGTACDRIRVGYRCRHVGRHIVYYTMRDYGIAVVRVLHDRMLASRHL